MTGSELLLRDGGDKEEGTSGRLQREYLEPGKKVLHQRLGTGRVIRWFEDGSLVVVFIDRPGKRERLFPDLLQVLEL